MELRGLKPLPTLQAFVTAKAVTRKAKFTDVIAAVILRSVFATKNLIHAPAHGPPRRRRAPRFGRRTTILDEILRFAQNDGRAVTFVPQCRIATQFPAAIDWRI
jgi:hypothetical protein